MNSYKTFKRERERESCRFYSQTSFYILVTKLENCAELLQFSKKRRDPGLGVFLHPPSMINKTR